MGERASVSAVSAGRGGQEARGAPRLGLLLVTRSVSLDFVLPHGWEISADAPQGEVTFCAISGVSISGVESFAPTEARSAGDAVSAADGRLADLRVAEAFPPREEEINIHVNKHTNL